MKNKFSDARSQNLLHEARLKSVNLENEIDDAEDELNRLRSKKFSVAMQRDDIIKASNVYRLVEVQLSVANQKIEELSEQNRLQAVELASLKGKNLVNLKGKLESHEIEESKQFRNLQEKFNAISIKHEKAMAEARTDKQNYDSLLKEIVRVLEVSLDESTVIPSRRDFLNRKIQKLKAGDLASLPSILVDLTY
jgi:hypothetical protein